MPYLFIPITDYKELWALRNENQELSEVNQFLKEEINNIFDKLTDPKTREKIFLPRRRTYRRKTIITSGGSGGSDSDFRLQDP